MSPFRCHRTTWMCPARSTYKLVAELGAILSAPRSLSCKLYKYFAPFRSSVPHAGGWCSLSLCCCCVSILRGLCASWEEGLPASCVSDFLERHAAAGGVLVGWEIHNDLDVVGFEKVSSVCSQEKPVPLGIRRSNDRVHTFANQRSVKGEGRPAECCLEGHFSTFLDTRRGLR